MAHRPIRLIYPFSPGAGDFLARAIAEKMREMLGQSVVVDDRPGTNAMIAAEAAARPGRLHAGMVGYQHAGDEPQPLSNSRHPWTNGQVERMNRTLKEATVRRFHYETHDQLRSHLTDFVNAYNFGRRLKTLKELTPYEAICKSWTAEPERFTLNPLHQMPGPNI